MPPGASFLYNCYYGGLMADLGEGTYTAARLNQLQLNLGSSYTFTGSLSSLKVREGFMVTLFSLDFFQGDSRTIAGGCALCNSEDCLADVQFNDFDIIAGHQKRYVWMDILLPD
jgi:hypothetical protein